MIFEIGRLCMKTAGRDAGRKCIVIDIIDNNFVLIDGETRRRKCNIKHLEPTNNIIKINKNAAHDEVKDAFKELNLNARESKPKEKKERPRKVRKKKVKEVEKKKQRSKKAETKSKKSEKEVDKILKEKIETLEEVAGLKSK